MHPIASPEPHEKARHYLWRFWTRLPKTGHIAIFDRTWYGRVMVERLEGFCGENDWKRAYNEINEFEKELSDWGAVIIKFWVQIDKDTQLARFKERQETPEKQWKITDEDWRNQGEMGSVRGCGQRNDTENQHDLCAMAYFRVGGQKICQDQGIKNYHRGIRKGTIGPLTFASRCDILSY